MKKGAGSRNPRNAQIDIPARLPKIKVKEPTGSRRKQHAGKYQHYGSKGHSAGKGRKYPIQLGRAVGTDPHGRGRKNAGHRHTPLCPQHHGRHDYKNVQRGGGNGRKLNVSQIGKGKHRLPGHQHQDDLLQFLFRQSDPISLSKTLHMSSSLYLFLRQYRPTASAHSYERALVKCYRFPASADLFPWLRGRPSRR